jgi:hypothetical protein
MMLSGELERHHGVGVGGRSGTRHRRALTPRLGPPDDRSVIDNVHDLHLIARRAV